MCFSSFHSHCFGMIIDTMIWRSVYYSQYFLNVMLALTFPHVFHNTAVVSGSDVLCALVLVVCRSIKSVPNVGGFSPTNTLPPKSENAPKKVQIV